MRVLTLTGYQLGWFDGEKFIPNQCLVSSDVSDRVVSSISGCEVVDGTLICRVSRKRIARLERDVTGRITNLRLI
jgi:hypothetical protein